MCPLSKSRVYSQCFFSSLIQHIFIDFAADLNKVENFFCCFMWDQVVFLFRIIFQQYHLFNMNSMILFALCYQQIKKMLHGLRLFCFTTVLAIHASLIIPDHQSMSHFEVFLYMLLAKFNFYLKHGESSLFISSNKINIVFTFSFFIPEKYLSVGIQE